MGTGGGGGGGGGGGRVCGKANFVSASSEGLDTFHL